MKLEGIKSNISTYKINSPIKNSSPIGNNYEGDKITTYNPLYYKPNISFKAKLSDEYLPADILGISEEKLNEILNEAVESTEKREKISKYVISELSKDPKAIEFISLWEKQVPSISSEDIVKPFGFDKSNNLLKELTDLINGTTSSDTLRRFAESNEQTQTILKDSHQVGVSLLSSKLFEIGMEETDPEFKSYLLGASLVIGSASWPQQNTETRNIQSKQFVETTKELLKMGIADPLKLINKISPDRIELTQEKRLSYNKWRENKQANEKRISKPHKDLTSDFNTEQGKLLIKRSIDTLEKAGLDLDGLNEYLRILGLICLSSRETNEAQFILELSIGILQKTYGPDSIETVPALDMLARTQAENQQYLAARETYKTALDIRRKNNADPIQIFNSERRLYQFDQQIRSELQDRSDFMNFDDQISLTGARKKKLEHENGKIKEAMPQITYETNELEENLIEFTHNDLFKTLPLEQRAAVLTELIKSLSSKLMPISRLIAPIKQIEKEFSDVHYLLPIELFTVTNDSGDLIEAIQGNYGSGSRSELAILEQQGLQNSEIDKLKKAYELSKETSGNNNSDSPRLLFAIADMSKERKDINDAISIIGKSEVTEVNRNYLSQLNTLLMETYLEEAISSSKLSQVEAALKSAKESYLQAVLIAPDYRNMQRTISTMMRFINQHPTLKGDYEKTDKGGEYNNFREETYMVTETIDTFNKQRIIEETIKLFENNPGKNNINIRKALQLLSSNLNSSLFIGSKKRKIAEQIARLEQQAEVDETK